MTRKLKLGWGEKLDSEILTFKDKDCIYDQASHNGYKIYWAADYVCNTYLVRPDGATFCASMQTVFLDTIIDYMNYYDCMVWKDVGIMNNVARTIKWHRVFLT